MSESTFKRVFHPTLPGSFQDVKASDVESWSQAGWLKTKPKDFDDSDALPVGEFYVATVPVDVTDEVPAPGKADAK